MKYYVGIDLGGTNITAAVLDEAFSILDNSSIPTPVDKGAEGICESIAGLIRKMLKRHNINEKDIPYVGVGAPGLIVNGIIRYANNLMLYDVPFSEMLEKKLNKKVYLSGDASAAAYGEYISGAGKGCSSVVTLTLGTGVGGGIVLNGSIHTGVFGLSPQSGHMVVEPGGRLCTCGRRGCLEAYCSATALKTITMEKMEKHSDSIMWELCGGNAANATALTAFDADRKEDFAGHKIVADYISWLALGINNITNFIFPEVVILGGGISNEGEYLLSRLREALVKIQLFDDNELMPKILCASLGNSAGLIGAALLAHNKN